MFYFLLFLSFLCLSAGVGSDLSLETSSDYHVDLKNPIYEDGVIFTDQGGVITGKNLRIQALKLTYTHQLIQHALVSTVKAEGELNVEFGDYIFTGEKLFYNFETKEGAIQNGRTYHRPWFLGGETLKLCSDGSFLIDNGYFTTSENLLPDWAVYSKKITVEERKKLTAFDISLRVNRFRFFWLPRFKTDLDTLFESPIRYRFKWGGRQGPRLGASYQLFSWNRWKSFLRLDYRITRGPGGGLEFYYLSDDRKTKFESINYVSNDSSLIHLHEKIRYRFKGCFQTEWNLKKTTALLTYDKLSDIDLPQSYDDHDFRFETSERTQLLVRHQEKDWISNFYTRVRVNSFQTVKEQLPSFSTRFKPVLIGNSAIVWDNWATASFLDYKYSDNFNHTKDYSSTRFEYQPCLYRPFFIKPITLTPKIGAVGIIYGNSPSEEAKWLALSAVGITANTQLHRYYGQHKHLIEPYLDYSYYSAPTVSANEHFIFDINDGWTRLNQLTLGLKNGVYVKQTEQIKRVFYSHLFAHAFFDQHYRQITVPKIYTELSYCVTAKLKNRLETAWDCIHHQIDHFNFLTEWTISNDFAITWEYRRRSQWSWRKVDQTNFFLEAFRNNQSLLHSTVSDRRQTLLTHFFYRFRPNLACEFVSRQGWDRKKEPKYFEFEVNFFTTIQTAWNLQLSYQHQESEDRVAIYLNLISKSPKFANSNQRIYRFD